MNNKFRFDNQKKMYFILYGIIIFILGVNFGYNDSWITKIVMVMLVLLNIYTNYRYTESIVQLERSKAHLDGYTEGAYKYIEKEINKHEYEISN